jgi:hypothetical protein
MVAKFDIFKKTAENDFIWVEAVQDIFAAKKRLTSLSFSAPAEYRLWDSTEQRFVSSLDGYTERGPATRQK